MEFLFTYDTDPIKSVVRRNLFQSFLRKCYENNTRKFVIYFHNPCADGFMSMCVMRQALISELEGYNVKVDDDTIVLHGINYGFKELPKFNDSAERAHIFVDFSIPSNELLALDKKQYKTLLMIDHHKSAIDDYSSIVSKLTDDDHSRDYFFVFDNSGEYAGANLVFDTVVKKSTAVPQIVKAVALRDLWKPCELSRETHVMMSMHISEYNKQIKINTEDSAFKAETVICSINNQLCNDDLYHHYVGRFTEVVKYQDSVYESLASSTISKVFNEIEVCGVIYKFDKPTKIGILNCPGMFASNTSELIYAYCDIAITFNVKNFDTVAISFRANGANPQPILDIAKIANGGGHANACSCSMTITQFADFIKQFKD